MKFIRTLLSYWWPWPEAPEATSMDSPIEPLIKPLVDVLNSCAHIRTTASCQGHGPFRPPFVIFETSTEIAIKLSRKLHEICWENNRCNKTHYEWVLEGRFNYYSNEQPIFYVLRCPRLDEVSNEPDARWWLHVYRDKLNEDLSNLQMALKPFLLEMRTSNKVEV